MFPPRQRPRRLGQSQRLQQMQQNPVRHHEVNPTTQAVRALQRRRGPSRKIQGRQEMDPSKPWVDQASASPDDSTTSQNRDRHEVQTVVPPSLMGVLQQVIDQLDYAIVAIDTAADNIEKKDARQLKTTKWL
ncbi:hypothetical protein CABS03_15449 [Colletotrichum abscissum]